MKKSYLIAIASLVIITVTGCSKTSDYSPAAGASGEDIFKAACIECHKDAAPKIFTFTADSANPATIQKAIANGNMAMPKFPNITDDALNKLTEYVLNNSEKQ